MTNNMNQDKNIPFQTIYWTSKGYIADHWCQKGHIVYCLDGEFVSELQDGKLFNITKGSTYVVSDGLSSHRSISKEGVKLMIIDGDFLQQVGFRLRQITSMGLLNNRSFYDINYNQHNFSTLQKMIYDRKFENK